MRKPFIIMAMAILAVAAGIIADVPARSGQVPRVVASIKPIHSLVAAIMQGVGKPELLVTGNLPATLPPDAASKLRDADLIFWVGPNLEKFLERDILLRKKGAIAIALMDAPGIRLMALPTNTPSAVVVAPKPDDKAPPKADTPKTEATKPALPPRAAVPPPAAKSPAKPPAKSLAKTPAKPSTKKSEDDSFNPDADKSQPDEPPGDAAVPPAEKIDAKTPTQSAQSTPERKTLVIPPAPEGKLPKSPDDEPEGDDTGEADPPKVPPSAADPRLLGPRLDPGTHITRRPVDPKEVRKEDLQVGNPDPYIWLDPRNAVALVRAIAGTLSQVDPANARLYQRNAAALLVNIESVDSEITGLVGDIDTRPFASVNQSFQYFEANYVLRPRSRVNFGNLSPPAERINDARDRLRREDVLCVFYPAAFDARAATGLVNGIPTRAAAIDPFGADIKPGPDAYAELIRRIGDTYWECLSARRR